MSDVSTAAEYIYFKNSTVPSSTAKTFVDGAARAVLGLVNSSTENFRYNLEEEELLAPGNLNETSADYLIGNTAEDDTTLPTTAVNVVFDSVTKNVSRAIQIISEEETSTETFRFTTEETNNSFIGNFTAMNSTLSEPEKMNPAFRDLMFFVVIVFICGILFVAQLMNVMNKQSDNNSDEVYSPSEVVAKYRARYPKIDEEDENDVEFGLTDSNPVGEQDGGEIRKTEPLIPCTPPKPKKNKDYTSLPVAWDFDGKIVAQVENEHLAATNVDAMKDSETQTTLEEIDNADNAMTTELVDQLKEECKTFEFMDA